MVPTHPTERILRDILVALTSLCGDRWGCHPPPGVPAVSPVPIPGWGCGVPEALLPLSVALSVGTQPPAVLQQGDYS